ncbi:hypothetical protein [Vibrio cholerae]|uniref:hypothetical protein n=1 Tax=Vibrio cholerae TaxID=666 RepID=UPI0013C2F96E|nr:hypothetical protein [Vibrio cholerae]MDX5050007.1 hypothetical protein [Vibrio cholerae]GIB17204.1 hypothetical protein VCSRO90_2923 [Vibrio cholerae]
MKQRWSLKEKAIRNLIEAARLRGDEETVKRLEKRFQEERQVNLSNQTVPH